MRKGSGCKQRSAGAMIRMLTDVVHGGGIVRDPERRRAARPAARFRRGHCPARDSDLGLFDISNILRG
ncbi:MAG TPA: hypothetical protein VER09_05895, partial [Pseudomonas sp.]|nr:hypothetical protein [Pseudomonas sp.]